MKLKQYLWIVICLIALAVSVLPAYSQEFFQAHAGFQVSTLGALQAGVYQGAATIAELKHHGNFGLGTLEGLDGEMVILDGKFYQIKSDHVAYPVADGSKTPFSTVTFFCRWRSFHLPGKMNYQELQRQIDIHLPKQNLPYAIRIKGSFPSLRVRSVPKQAPPYRHLKDVLSQQQVEFKLPNVGTNVQGTLVGFRLPQYFKDVNQAGYHFHFIKSDSTTGGHLLDGVFINPTVDVQPLQHWQIMLPNNTAFEQALLE